MSSKDKKKDILAFLDAKFKKLEAKTKHGHNK